MGHLSRSISAEIAYPGIHLHYHSVRNVCWDLEADTVLVAIVAGVYYSASFMSQRNRNTYVPS